MLVIQLMIIYLKILVLLQCIRLLSAIFLKLPLNSKFSYLNLLIYLNQLHLPIPPYLFIVSTHIIHKVFFLILSPIHYIYFPLLKFTTPEPYFITVYLLQIQLILQPIPQIITILTILIIYSLFF